MPGTSDPPTAASEAWFERLRDDMARREDELIALHRALVAIETVNPGGGASAHETRLAEYGAAWLETRGVRARLAAAQPERANLLAEIGAGDDNARAMLWMSHSDVVPPGDATAWTHPPFSGALADGRIWGRGAYDCKMLVAAQLFALGRLAALGWPAHGRVRLAVGADEEVGGALGFGWLAEHEAEFLRADAAICEGGGATLGRFEGDRPVLGVGVGEKGRSDVIFRVRGEGGHACSPWGRLNPLAVLAELIARLERFEAPARPASPIFERVGLWIGRDETVTEHNLEEAIEAIAQRAPALARSLRGQSRMTLTPTVMRGGDKSNSIPDEARLVCDARLLPGQTSDDLARVAAELADGLEAVEIAFETTCEPSACAWGDDVEGLFRRAASRAAGEPVAVAPGWCTGATDAHHVRRLGTPVYGFQFVHPAADPTRLGLHCVDESIEVGMLGPCALALAALAVDFLDESEAQPKWATDELR